MTEQLDADLCVIGAGSGGLSLAAGAAQLGRKVVLIERHKMGGDCLNYGCVPSKSLISAAHHAHAARRAREFGISVGAPTADFPRVMTHVQSVIAAIEPNDSVERFEKLGVRVIKAPAKFASHGEVEAGGYRIAARYFAVATGSSPFTPPIPGLSQTPYLTNETVFQNATLPDHLIVVGGGPIGVEMAQAHRRLGARVTLVEARQIMPKDDPEAVAVIRDALQADGVNILENAAVTWVGPSNGGVAVTVSQGAKSEVIAGSHLLLAAGRAPNVEALGLDAAGVKYSRRGIEVDAGLRTSNKRIFALGDVAGGFQFTHAAGHHASLLIRRLFFKLPINVNNSVIPWCTYTDPELAHVGTTEAQAREKGLKVSVARWSLHENDRAQAERRTEGFAKIVVAGGRAIGATIVAPHGGDLILPWVLAISQRTKLSAVAGLVAPYPTFSEVSKRAAGAHFTPRLFSASTRALVRALSWLG